MGNFRREVLRERNASSFSFFLFIFFLSLFFLRYNRLPAGPVTCSTMTQRGRNSNVHSLLLSKKECTRCMVDVLFPQPLSFFLFCSLSLFLFSFLSFSRHKKMARGPRHSSSSKVVRLSGRSTTRRSTGVKIRHSVVSHVP